MLEKDIQGKNPVTMEAGISSKANPFLVVWMVLYQDVGDSVTAMIKVFKKVSLGVY